MSVTIHHPLFGRIPASDRGRDGSRTARLRRLLAVASLQMRALLGSWRSGVAAPAEEDRGEASVFHRWAASELAARDMTFVRPRNPARR